MVGHLAAHLGVEGGPVQHHDGLHPGDDLLHLLALGHDDEMYFKVTDVQKNKGGKYMHYGKMHEGTLKVGDAVCASIDFW